MEIDAFKRIAEGVVRSVVAGDERAFNQRVAPDATLRLWRWDGREVHRPRERAYRRLADEWKSWDRPLLEILGVTADHDRAVVELQIFTTEAGSPVEHNRVLILSPAGERISLIDFYCARAVPSSAHLDRLAHAAALHGIGEADLLRRLPVVRYPGHSRRLYPQPCLARFAPDLQMYGTTAAHPGANQVRHARFSPDRADDRIAEVIEFHRRRNMGFSWLVGSYDTPADLAARLVRHGCVHAGGADLMVRSDQPCDDIAINPDVTIVEVDADDDRGAETCLQIVATGFQWPAERVESFRDLWFDRMQNPEVRVFELPYLAYLGGRPAAFASLTLRAGVALLDGGATLPAYRNRKVYSSLLRHRLERARGLGYTHTIVEAMPMSRRVVARYGFESRGRLEVYAWMPVMDMDVIGSLVQRDDNQPDS